MRFSIKPIYAVAVVAVIVLAQSAFAQRDRDDSNRAGWLGVTIQDVTADLRDALPRNMEDGALINHVVSGSPAEEAGLEEGDVVVRIDRERVSDADDLTRIIRNAGEGTRVRVEYYRDGRRKTTRVNLENASGNNASGAFRRSDRNSRRHRLRSLYPRHDDLKFFDTDNWSEEWPMLFGVTKPRLGVRMMDMGDQLADYFNVSGGKGALITEVLKDSPAETAGIKAGDVITGINDREIKNADGLRKAMGRLDEGGDVSVKLVRDGRNKTVVVALEEIERPGHQAFVMPGPGVMPFLAPGRGSGNWRGEMKDLREQLKELKEELSELKSDLR